MTWAQLQRMDFIRDRLASGQSLRRRDLMEKFRISIATASADIRSYVRMHPNAVRYNASEKRYERATT